MIVTKPPEIRADYLACRNRCEQAMALVGDAQGEERQIWYATCLRHLAITYELEALITEQPSERTKLYQKWSALSEEAADILTRHNEDGVRGYALMNRASSHTRLSRTVSPHMRRQHLLAGEADLKRAVEALDSVQDVRGMVWAYVHLCENFSSQIELAMPHDVGDLAARAEDYAAIAVSYSRLIGDELVGALALRELGVALSRADRESSVTDGLRLSRARSSLWESSRMLTELGYYFGAGAAYNSLAGLLERQWRERQEITELLEGVRAVTAGIITMGEALDAKDRLLRVFSILRRELGELLDT